MMKKAFTLFILLILLPLVCFPETYSIYKVNGKYGLINSKAEVVIKAVNQGIYCFDDYIFVIASEKLLKVYNTELEQIDQIFYKSGPIFQEVYQICDTLFCISLLRPKGTLIYEADAKSKQSIPGILAGIYDPYNYDRILPVLAQRNDGRNYMTPDGEPLLGDNSYRLVYPFVNGRAVVITWDNACTIIDETGTALLQVKDCGQYFRDGLLPVILLTGETGYINTDCEFVFQCPLVQNRPEDRLDYNPVVNYLFSNGYAYVQVRKDVWQVYDNNGNPVSEELAYTPTADLRRSIYFTEGLLPINDSDTRKVGYINTKGELAIPVQFYRAEPFENGLAIVCDSESGRYGYINTLGEYVIPPVFDFVEPFINGFAVVKYEGRDAVVDMTGTIYFSTELQKQN